jgi:hypothetical protein
VNLRSETLQNIEVADEFFAGPGSAMHHFVLHRVRDDPDGSVRDR